MKKIQSVLFSTLIALCLVSLVSCGDDHDDFNKNDLAGQWIKASYKYELDCEPKEMKDVIVAYMERYNESNYKCVIEFDNKGKYWNYMLKGGSIADFPFDQGTYNISNDKIHITSDVDNEEQFTNTMRIELNNSSLHLISNETEFLQNEATYDYFWEELNMEKPNNFKVKKYIETQVMDKFSPRK